MNQNLVVSILQKQELPVGRCLLMDRDKLRIIYRGPSIDATYQISVHFGKRFQSRTFLEINPGQMNQNLVVSILRRSSIKIAHLVPIR
jgi:hypothetical protein